MLASELRFFRFRVLLCALERFAVGPQNHLWWKASFWSFLNLRLQ